MDFTNKLVLAPMAGVCDQPFRLLAKEQGCDILYTEMISAKGLYYDNKNTVPLLAVSPEEDPIGVQLFGSDPELLAEMAKKIERCKAQMQGQADLPEALASAEIFSNLYSRMVSVGFRSGSMDVVMLQIASHYEEETDRQLSRIVSIIEPTLVIILSLIVGVILLSVLLPLMGIMASIG